MESNYTLIQLSENNSLTNYSVSGNISSNFNATSGIQNDFGRIFVTFIAALVALSTILGNLLVIIAFKYDQHLQTLSNYYLVSLAVSDFTIGLVSMPFYTVYLLYGYWPLTPTLCDFWLSVDYAMTTASVANLLVISVDRYLSVRQPIRYRAKRTPRKVGIMIAYAWAIALLLWPPWIFAWPHIEGKRTVPFNDCYVQFLRSNSVMTLATSLITFYIPVTITTVLYFLIYKETLQQKKMLSAYRGGSTKNNSVVGDKTKHASHKESENKPMENSDITASGIKLKTNPISSVTDNRNNSHQDYVTEMPIDEGGLEGHETDQTRLHAILTLNKISSTQNTELNLRVQDLGPAMLSSSRPVEVDLSKRTSSSIPDHPSVNRRCKPVNVVLPMVVKPPNAALTGNQNRGFGRSRRSANLQALPNNNPGSRQERKIVRVLSVILLALIITFAPYYSVVIMEVYCNNCVKSIIHDIDIIGRANMTEKDGRSDQTCKYCDKQFKTCGALTNHMVVHTPRQDKQNVCDLCGKQYKFLAKLEQHILSHFNVKRYSCDICGRCFSQAESVKRHKDIHTGEKRHNCDVCGRQLGRKETLDMHMLLHTGDKPYTCDLCNHKCRQFGTLHTHIMGHIDVKLYSCSLCGKTFRQSNQLSSHLRVHNNEKPFHCELCGKNFRESGYLRKHQRFHAGIKLHKCDVCGQAFSNPDSLKLHYLIHTGEKNHECSVCGKRFARQGSLRAHKSVHTGERPYKCITCGKQFRQSLDLKSHIVIHSEVRAHSCTICGRTFKRYRGLTAHAVTHQETKPHSCDLCHKRFASTGGLKCHLVVHTKDKPFSCSICGQKFTQSGGLKLHTLIHNAEKPHKCDICGKGFRQARHLRDHKFTHGGEKPHRCDVCGKQFIEERHYQVHVLRHTGEKPHRCVTCGKQFADIRKLRNHNRIHMPEVHKTCHVCGKKYSTACALKRHMLTHKGSRDHKCGVCGKAFLEASHLIRHQTIHT